MYFGIVASIDADFGHEYCPGPLDTFVCEYRPNADLRSKDTKKGDVRKAPVLHPLQAKKSAFVALLSPTGPDHAHRNQSQQQEKTTSQPDLG